MLKIMCFLIASTLEDSYRVVKKKRKWFNLQNYPKIITLLVFELNILNQFPLLLEFKMQFQQADRLLVKTVSSEHYMEVLKTFV